jgi:hypothetical protein
MKHVTVAIALVMYITLMVVIKSTDHLKQRVSGIATLLKMTFKGGDN